MALTPKGSLVIIGGSDGRWINGLGRENKVRVLSPFVSQRLQPFLTKWNGQNLDVVKKLIEAGKVTPVIGRTYLLREASETMRDLGRRPRPTEVRHHGVSAAGGR